MMVDWCLTALSTQTGYIMPPESEKYYVGPGEGQDKYTIKQ